MAIGRASRPALSWLWSLSLLGLGCEPGASFEVIEVMPAAGVVVADDVEPELTFSEPFDPQTCTAQTLFLAMLGPTGQAEQLEGVVLRIEDEQTVVLRPASRLRKGRWRIGVQTGRLGCQSQWGEGIAPFASDFVVGE
ncbi:MAG: hypothetical protein EA397_20155 [Deltaproteobacteria bacterium]|nr:MAG: hypothetical protein EA397_20155 [Deltaproteobacteria bacterium]